MIATLRGFHFWVAEQRCEQLAVVVSVFCEFDGLSVTPASLSPFEYQFFSQLPFGFGRGYVIKPTVSRTKAQTTARGVALYVLHLRQDQWLTGDCWLSAGCLTLHHACMFYVLWRCRHTRKRWLKLRRRVMMMKIQMKKIVTKMPMLMMMAKVYPHFTGSISARGRNVDNGWGQVWSKSKLMTELELMLAVWSKTVLKSKVWT